MLSNKFKSWFIWFKIKLKRQTPRNCGKVNICPFSKQRCTNFLQKTCWGAYSDSLHHQIISGDFFYWSHTSTQVIVTPIITEIAIALCTAVVLQRIFALSCRSEQRSLLKTTIWNLFVSVSDNFCPLSRPETAIYSQLITL